jgi:hypothetical protein
LARTATAAALIVFTGSRVSPAVSRRQQDADNLHKPVVVSNLIDDQRRLLGGRSVSEEPPTCPDIRKRHSMATTYLAFCYSSGTSPCRPFFVRSNF